MLILAFESSCDETAAAVVEDGRVIRSDAILSQVDVHALYGGVVPEIASRKHVEAIAALADRALADGGVTCGLPRQKALLYAAQMLKGTAALQLATGTHPGALKDAVCSPGGSTIAGVRTLEERGFRGAAMDAVIAAVEKTKELGK